MYKKKGQVTIFIILAIIIAGGIIFYFSIKGSEQESYSPELTGVVSFIKNCIEETGLEATYYIGQNGGYYSPPEISTLGKTPYYYYENENLMPSKQKVENEISNYIDKMLGYCIEEFVDFQDMKIDAKEIKSNTKIYDEEIIINVNYPLIIEKDNTLMQIENFNDIKIQTRVGIIYDSIKEIIKQQQKSKETICISCITNIALKNDLTIEITKTQDATIFIIKDEKSEINNIPLKWVFANKY